MHLGPMHRGRELQFARDAFVRSAFSSASAALAGQLAESDPDARTAIAAGLERWEAHLRDGLTRMRARGKLRKDADPAALATATMACIQGGLLLTQIRRDPRQLRIALDAARNNLRLAAA